MLVSCVLTTHTQLDLTDVVSDPILEYVSTAKLLTNYGHYVISRFETFIVMLCTNNSTIQNGCNYACSTTFALL